MTVIPSEARLDAALEQAALWCVRLADDEMTPAEQARLQAWFDADEAHRGLLD
ncbi:FecR/PupR family sigma factor regulator, partial [Caulobacter sp.]|uniref:FecR/PupR family sigma factor regulator n=1 Tax=Caulobacter sp. TaxID=78 RepID=UPI003BAF2F53